MALWNNEEIKSRNDYWIEVSVVGGPFMRFEPEESSDAKEFIDRLGQRWDCVAIKRVMKPS